jgi:hypothetical protein
VGRPAADWHTADQGKTGHGRAQSRPSRVQREAFAAAEVVDYRWITNSGGGREKRFVIVTALQMGSDVWPIEVTLTDRDQMGFRMLIGRTAMEHRLIVDPTKSYRLGKPRKTNGAFKKRSVPARADGNMEEE